MAAHHAQATEAWAVWSLAPYQASMGSSAVNVSIV
jgi:hypothetical protein